MVRTDGDTAEVGEGQQHSVDSVPGQEIVVHHQHAREEGVQLHQHAGLSYEGGVGGHLHRDEPRVGGRSRLESLYKHIII